MCLFRYDNDPEPEKPAPTGPLYVPVRSGTGPETVIRLFRTPLGARTAVAFTTTDRLTAVLGEAQPYIRLSESVLRGLCEPVGVSVVTLDPAPPAPTVLAAPRPPAVRPGRPVRALRVV
ncbi:SAV_915 family protein [Streptomyces sp. NPDC054861]